MPFETFAYSVTDAATRERILSDSARWNLLLAHVILPPGEEVHAHPVDADGAFFIVVRGMLTMRVEGHPDVVHPRGTVLHLPKGAVMSPRNAGSETLEFFVLKTPHP